MSSDAPASTYRQKVAKLEQSIDQASQSVKSKERCFPTFVVAGAVFPLILAAVLFFWQPPIVQVKENGKMVRSNKKLFYWTLGITLVVWAGMYGYTWWSGRSGGSVCAK